MQKTNELFKKTHELLSNVRKKSLAEINNYFNFLFFSMTSVVGSISSFLLSAAFVWAFILFQKEKLKFLHDQKIYFIALIFALYPLSELLSSFINLRGLPGFLSAMGSLLFLSVLPILSRLAVSTRESIIQSTGCGAAVGAILAAVFSGIQYFLLDESRAEAGLGNASILAVYALISSCVCVALLPAIMPRWRNLLVVGAACGLGAVVLAGTRAAWIAAPFSLAAAAWPLFISKIKLQFDAKFAFGAFLAGGASILCLQFMYARAKETLLSFDPASLMSTDSSISTRMALWRGGWEQVKASWLFGYGPDSATELVPLTTSDGFFTFTHYHNFLLTALIRGGIVEAAAQILIFGVVVWVAFQKSASSVERCGRTLLLSVLIAIVVPSTVGVLFTHDIINALFIYTIIVGMSIALPQARHKYARQDDRSD